MAKTKNRFKKIIVKKDISRTNYFADVIGLSIFVVFALINPLKWLTLIALIITIIIWVSQTLMYSREIYYEKE